MAKISPQLEWCVVRLGEDMNWWVDEISDDIHWDVDGLSIIDPRQVSYILELIDPLREYGFDADLLEDAFFTFRIGKNLGEGRVKLEREHNEPILETEEKLFALPDILDEENGPYADFIDHIVKLRVKLLNDTFDFEQKLTADELEEEIRDEQNNSFLEGRSVHLFNEVVSILEYVPAGWEMEDDSEEDKEESNDDAAAFPDIEDDDQDALSEDETMRWDEEEDDDEAEEEEETESLDDLEDDDLGEDDFEEDAEDEVKVAPRRRKRKKS